MRIDVVGLPASGKSTFADAISKKLSIPHIHLDRFWFKSGGKQGRHNTPNLDEVRTKVKESVVKAISADSWVSDGMYLHIQDVIVARADIIIFLNISLLSRLWNHAQRSFFQSKRHPELTIWHELTFFREIIRRQITRKPKLLQFISEHKDKVIILKSRKEMNVYLRQL